MFNSVVRCLTILSRFYLREQAEAWRQLGKFAPVVDITEVDGVNHRDILKHDVAINTIIDAACI
jgi:hypothetical protein